MDNPKIHSALTRKLCNNCFAYWLGCACHNADEAVLYTSIASAQASFNFPFSHSFPIPFLPFSYASPHPSLNSKTRNKKELTNFPSARYGEKCSEFDLSLFSVSLTVIIAQFRYLFPRPNSQHEAVNKRKSMKSTTQLDGPNGTTMLEVRMVHSLDPLNIESNRAQLMSLGKSTARGDAE